jgi:pyruvate, water dikinase
LKLSTPLEIRVINKIISFGSGNDICRLPAVCNFGVPILPPYLRHPVFCTFHFRQQSKQYRLFFCRTVEEGKKVLEVMEEYRLKRGENELQVYMMVEIPSNVIQAKEFSKIFYGFSIGSNDLTQLTLGLDRDSSTVSELFNEQDPAVKEMISMAITSARVTGTPIGLCGQAPSDIPEFAEFLIRQGINSISFNPDALLQGIKHMLAAEKKIRGGKKILK